MARRQRREAQKHEGAHNASSRTPVRTVLGEEDEDVIAAELLLGKLEQGDEGLSRALGQGAAGQLDKQAALAQNRLPAHLRVLRQTAAERQPHRFLAPLPRQKFSLLQRSLEVKSCTHSNMGVVHRGRF
ncbi:unnamed protein product [Ixodes persulcatus]